MKTTTSSTKNTKAALLLLAALLAGCAPFRVGDIRIGNTPARKIAKDMSIPGKGVDGQCLPYAIALHRKFQAAGIRSKVLVFSYESLAADPRNKGGAHAIVSYDDDGRTYLMDNQSWLPTWVHNDNALGLAQQFAGMDNNVLAARPLGEANIR